MVNVILAIAVAALLLLSATLAASETALFALVRMEDTRDKLSARVREACDRLLARPLEALLVIVGLNEACNIFAECLATALLLTWLGAVGAWVAAPLMLFVVLIFCDITPKTFALGYPGGVALISARPLRLAAQIAHPLVRWLVPAMAPPRPAPVSEQEFKALLRAGELVGEVEPQERELIHKVFDFGNRRVAEIMTSREKLFAIDAATPPDRLIAEVARGHFSRVPIYRGAPDNIVGVLHVKDLVTRRLGSVPPRLERLTRPAYFIPPAKRLGELFDEMRRGRFQLALVVGEFGGLLGLITLEDLLEELFGEIRDEFDYDGPELMPAGPGEWLAAGAIDLARLRAALGDQGSLAAAGPQTLNGLVLRQLKRVPRRGEDFQLGDFHARVERVRGATVELVRLRR
ncbi:MAG: hemolysin family protein [Candidatus Binataceae bacterium]